MNHPTSKRRKAPGPGKYDRSLTPEERRNAQRMRLIWAAADVFAAKGYAYASVDLIVRKVRMSRRTFYEHFDDLGDALVQVMEAAARTLFDHVERAVRAEDDPIAKLTVGITSYLRGMQQSAALARVLFHEVHGARPKEAARLEAMRMRFVTLWFEGLAEAYACGIAKRLPSEAVMYGVVTAIESIALRYILHGDEERILEAAPELIDLAMSAVLVTDSDIQQALELEGRVTHRRRATEPKTA